MVIAAIQAAQSPEPAHRVPVHVVAALVVAGASLGIVLPWYTTRFEARHQPDVLVRQLLEDPRMRSYARTALINMSAAEREKARPALIQALNQPGLEVQLAAASVLAVTEADTAFVVARLIDLLDTPFQQRDFAGIWPPSVEAAQVLATMGPKAAPAVSHSWNVSVDPRPMGRSGWSSWRQCGPWDESGARRRAPYRCSYFRCVRETIASFKNRLPLPSINSIQFLHDAAQGPH